MGTGNMPAIECKRRTRYYYPNIPTSTRMKITYEKAQIEEDEVE